MDFDNAQPILRAGVKAPFSGENARRMTHWLLTVSKRTVADFETELVRRRAEGAIYHFQFKLAVR